MSVTQRYIDLLLPSLIESNYGTLSTTKTEEGFNAYSFSCPFCSKFVHSKKCKKTETEILGQMQADQEAYQEA